MALRDVSIIPESPGAQGSGPNIALWAVSDKGDVLCRLGVSELNPEVGTGGGTQSLPSPLPPQGSAVESGCAPASPGLTRTVPGPGGHHTWPEGVSTPAGTWS